MRFYSMLLANIVKHPKRMAAIVDILKDGFHYYCYFILDFFFM
jgi:hypothetical protein